MRHLKATLFMVFAGVMCAAALWVSEVLVERAVIRDAERRAMAWADHAAVRLDRIAALAAGAEPTPEDWGLIEEMARFGDVFRFKVFSPDGILRFVSDDRTATGTSLGEHNATAAAVLQTGQPSTEVGDGRGRPDRPDLYSETYLPVRRDGRVVAIAEVYLDQTETQAVVRAEYALFGIAIVTLTGLAFAGPAIALLAVLRRLRARNAELDVERDRALAADRAKTEFLTTVSHELRTPMNGVIGVAQILETTELDEDQHELVEVLKASAEQQMSLIEQLLAIGEIEAGAVQLRESIVELPQLLGAATAAARLAAVAKEVALELSVPDDVPAIVTDDERLCQIVANLVYNAVKFTDEGSVRVAATVDARGGDGAVLTLSVADTGPGIAPDQQERIFDRFTQADSSIRREKGGTGLGLAISRRSRASWAATST